MLDGATTSDMVDLGPLPLRVLIGAMVERARARNGVWRNTNPSTGLPNRGKRGSPGAKLARKAYHKELTQCW
jgi:hypothetical protein